MKIFLDFDRTLYDLDAFHEVARDVFETHGVPREKYNESKASFSHGSGKAGGLYTPEEHDAVFEKMSVKIVPSPATCIRGVAREGKQFVFDDVFDFLQKIEKHQKIILTFGDAEYQRFKISGAGLDSFIDDIIVTNGEKWEEIQKAMRPDESAIFIDDHRDYFLQPRGNQPVYGIHLVRKDNARNFCDGCRAPYHASDLQEVSEIIKNLE